MVFHSLHNFCAVDLSSLYLDILKDRLYTSPASSPERRAAQTALYKILDALVRLMAPVLSFTAEEVWEHLPGAGKRAASVHLTLFPEVEPRYLDENLESEWNRLLEVRGEVSKALETARKGKLIGNSLEAAGHPAGPGQAPGFPEGERALLKDLFIVSQVNIVDPAVPAGAYASKEVEGLNSCSPAPTARNANVAGSMIRKPARTRNIRPSAPAAAPPSGSLPPKGKREPEIPAGPDRKRARPGPRPDHQDPRRPD